VVTLPRPLLEEAHDLTTRPDPFFSDKRGLIVDDEALIRTLLARYLTGLGCLPSLEASDGNAALVIARQQPVDFVLCDLNMRPMDGIEFLGRLRAMSHPVCDVPTLVLSGSTGDEITQRARGVKIDGYLLKPLRRAALCEKLTQAFDHRADSRAIGGDVQSAGDSSPDPFLFAADQRAYWHNT
jgi:two-component system chemotaxis response regulator CheY